MLLHGFLLALATFSWSGEIEAVDASAAFDSDGEIPGAVASVQAPAPVGDRKYWFGAGIATMGSLEHPALQLQFTARDLWPRWEASLQFAGVFLARNYFFDNRTEHSNSFRTYYERIKGAYLYPIESVRGFDGDEMMPFPGYLTAGAGLGCYQTTESIYDDGSPGGAGPVSSRRNHLFVLPFVEVGVIWKVSKRNEIRFSTEYALESKGLGRQGYGVGGLGISLTGNFRLN